MYSLFLPKTWPFPIKLLPQNAYLVGGSVRDQLLQRQPSYLDLDFVLSHKAVETAWNLSQKCNAGFVVLDEARQIARVVFDRATVDFAQQQGDSLEADLRRRDFTINAIAYHPLSQTLVDPLGGKDDIATQTLRMVSPENLAADPLRLMRAYRQAAQLGFTIEERTQQTIGDLAPKLQQVAIERVSSELDGLLSVPAGTAKLEAILQQRLLQFCLPHFTAQSIRQIEAIDGAIAQLKNLLPDYADSLEAWLEPVAAGFHRSWIKATKLSRLLARESAIAQVELSNLAYSRTEAQVVLTLLKAQPALNRMQAEALSRSAQFFLFKLAAKNFPAISLLALSQGIAFSRVEPMIAKFLDPADPVAHPQKLITGHEIMQQLGMKPGPQLGALIKSVEKAQAIGEISTKTQAISWLLQQPSTIQSN